MLPARGASCRTVAVTPSCPGRMSRKSRMISGSRTAASSVRDSPSARTRTRLRRDVHRGRGRRPRPANVVRPPAHAIPPRSPRPRRRAPSGAGARASVGAVRPTHRVGRRMPKAARPVNRRAAARARSADRAYWRIASSRARRSPTGSGVAASPARIAHLTTASRAASTIASDVRFGLRDAERGLGTARHRDRDAAQRGRPVDEHHQRCLLDRDLPVGGLERIAGRVDRRSRERAEPVLRTGAAARASPSTCGPRRRGPTRAGRSRSSPWPPTVSSTRRI